MDTVIKKLLLFFNANEDLQVFAMNGSRVDTKRKTDKFQDYDVVFFTENLNKYKEDFSFLNNFGEILILSEPDGVGCGNREKTFPQNDGYIYLAQFSNGLRLDVQFLKTELVENYLKQDSLTKIIADKNQLIKTPVIPTDKMYCQLMPQMEEIEYVIKEFWWQYLNTLKFALRGQFLLAQFYLSLVRDELITFLTYVEVSLNKREINYGKKKDELFQFLKYDEIQVIKQSYDTTSFEKIYSVLKTFAILENNHLEMITRQKGITLSKEVMVLNKLPKNYLLAKGEEELAIFFDETES